jgi:hypothetical protein
MAKYTVKTGDTIYGVAKNLGVMPDVLLNYNPGFTTLKPGMVLNYSIPKVKPFKPPPIKTVLNKTSNAYNTPTSITPSLSQANRLVTPTQTAQLGQAVPGTRGNIGYNGGITMFTREKEMSDVFANIGAGNKPVIVDKNLIDLATRYNPGGGITAYMLTNGYIKNPITGNYVLGGMQPAGPAKPGSPAPTYNWTGMTLLPTASTSPPASNYVVNPGYGTHGGGIDSAFVGKTSAMGGLSQSGYNQKGVPLSKTPWADRYKGRTDTTPPTSTSPKPPTTYSNNYVSYGVGLIHWRV